VLNVDSSVVDVRLKRNGLVIAETDPKFYVVAPCYAKVTFNKEPNGKIYGQTEKYPVSGGASNYCFLSEEAIVTLMENYGNEANCEAAMIAADLMSLGGKKAVEEGAVVAAKETIKEGGEVAAKNIVKEVVEQTLKQSGKNLGKQAQKTAFRDVMVSILKKFSIRDLRAEVAQLFVEGGGKAGAKRVLGREVVPEALGTAIEKKIAPKVIAEAGVTETAEATMKRGTYESVDYTFKNAPLEQMDKPLQKTLLKENAVRSLKAYDPTLTETEINEIISNPDWLKYIDEGTIDDIPIQKLPIQDAMTATSKDAITRTNTFQDMSKLTAVGRANAEADALGVAAKQTEGTVADKTTQFASEASTDYVMEYASNAALEFNGLSARSKATIVTKAFLNRYSTMEGMPTSRPEQILAAFGILPCVDADICRAGSACYEATLWPGGSAPKELTDSDMKSKKVIDTAATVFGECCTQYNYGLEKDPSKINCTEPSYLVDLVKPDLKINKTQNITLAKVAEYIGLPRQNIESSCKLSIGVNSKNCRDAEEMKKLHLVDNCQSDSSEHTYDFSTIEDTGTKSIIVVARLFEEGCNAKIYVELSDDGNNWGKPVATIDAKPYKIGEDSDNVIEITGDYKFRYLRIREDGFCLFDSTSVVLDPLASQVTPADVDNEYPLTGGTYSYFAVPAGFSSKASTLCKAVKYCTVVAEWETGSEGWVKWSDEGAGPTGEDFSIAGGDRIGVYATADSEIIFRTGAV